MRPLDQENTLLQFPSFLTQEESDHLYMDLITSTPWEQTYLNFGKGPIKVPRLVALYGSKPYTYSGTTLEPTPLPAVLDALREKLTNELGHPFNGVLLNLYRNGRDSVGMHADNEKELGPEPCIASISLGATRTFRLLQVATGKTHDLPLNHGDLIVMQGSSQQNYKHGVPKESQVTEPRINLTFRYFH